jgi:predicted dehydrogenase
MAESPKLRMGMVGGGPGAFIGAVHRVAAELDGRIEMVAGAFSSSPEKSRQAGASYRIDPARAYGSYEEMIAKEKQRPDGIDFVVIATPNNTHLPIAKAALQAGLPVMSDKPATATYDEVLELEKLVKNSGLPYGLTHTYAGYGLVRDARALCAAGEIGPVRKVVVDYLQGWLSEKLEATGQKQAGWRVDPNISGPGGCIGDIGTHAFHLLEYITGLEVTALQGTLRSVVEGRRVDDDCTALLKLNNGAQGILLASQIATGEGNGIRIRIYGEKASLHWGQENPNTLLVRRASGPDETRHASAGYLTPDGRSVARVPAGHPEGYFEAFAVLYREFADWLEAWRADKTAPAPPMLPGLRAGVRGMRFIERSIESNKTGAWVDF